MDPFVEKIDELVDRSRARVRADVVHGVLVAMGYEGSYRTTRGAVAEAKRRWRQRQGRRTRPWIPQPGLWLQWDYADGPVVAGRRAVLFCAWLAWSRFRVVVPLVDMTLPSVVIGLDRMLRLVGWGRSAATNPIRSTISSPANEIATVRFMKGDVKEEIACEHFKRAELEGRYAW